MRWKFSLLLPALLLPVSALADFTGRFPVYLFGDWRYWTFIVLYTLITIKIVLWTYERSPAANPAMKSTLARDVSTAAALIFSIAIIYQIAHHFEHITQIFQWWYMGLPPPQAKGIIFFADLEWNHFTFDMGYFWLLFIATMFFVRKWWLSGHRIGRMGSFLLIGMNLVQGWHAVEHTYRIMHHIQQGCEPCPGIMDQLTGIPLIPLHFWYNVLALTFPLMCYFWFGMHTKTMMLFRRKQKMENVSSQMALS